MPPDAPGTLKGKTNTMPGFDPASERLLAFEVGISNPTDHPLSLHPEAFTLEDANGNRFDRVIHSEVVGGETYRLEEFLPGQSRSTRVGFEASRNGQDLRLVFRPAGSAVALWIIPSVGEIPSGGVPAEAG